MEKRKKILLVIVMLMMSMFVYSGGIYKLKVTGVLVGSSYSLDKEYVEKLLLQIDEEIGGGIISVGEEGINNVELYYGDEELFDGKEYVYGYNSGYIGTSIGHTIIRINMLLIKGNRVLLENVLRHEVGHIWLGHSLDSRDIMYRYIPGNFVIYYSKVELGDIFMLSMKHLRNKIKWEEDVSVYSGNFAIKRKKESYDDRMYRETMEALKN